ncbi:MAG: Asp-tRNA(Asn)/Glu-tRNA(Gln) amidotransferase subunit GatB, partial [Halobacteriota archaeon]
NYRDMEITDVDGRLDEFKRLVELVATDEITTKNAEEVVLRAMLDQGTDPDGIVEAEGLGKTGADEIVGFVDEAIEENPEAVEDYHSGEGGALNFLVGQVMQKSRGSADPGSVNELLRERLADE